MGTAIRKGTYLANLWHNRRLALGVAKKVAGFSFHAGVIMNNAQDRSKFERLFGYITRSGISQKILAITTT